MRRLLPLLLVGWLLAPSAFAQKTLALRSPDGQLTYHLRLTLRAPVHAVDFHGKAMYGINYYCSLTTLLEKSVLHFGADLLA